MLAQLQSNLPSGDGWRYEPKLDGFRGLLQRHSSPTARLLSRNGRDLGPWFPELLQAALALPADTLIDGEIVVANERGEIDFGALQARLTVARKHVSRTASEQPAVSSPSMRSRWAVPASSMSRCRRDAAGSRSWYGSTRIPACS